MSSERPLVGVGVIACDPYGRVLMQKRRGSHGAGTWSFPGGHLEHGEDVIACAKRELYEETGLLLQSHIAVLGPYTNDVFTGTDKGKHYVTLYVVVRITEGMAHIREPDKCEELRWFKWDDMPPHDRLFLPVKNLVRTGYRPPMPPLDL